MKLPASPFESSGRPQDAHLPPAADALKPVEDSKDVTTNIDESKMGSAETSEEELPLLKSPMVTRAPFILGG